MANNSLLYFAQKMIQSNQNRIPNTPWAQSAVNAIMNGDAAAGQQIASNLCRSNGVTEQEALRQAGEYFTKR